MTHKGEFYFNEIKELLRDNDVSKLKAAGLIGKVNLLFEEEILTIDQNRTLINAIKIAGKLTEEKVDEALFLNNNDSKDCL